MDRHTFISCILAVGLAYGIGSSVAHSQDGAAVHIDQQTADWFSGLTRPFDDIEDGPEVKAGVASCCDAGDGYPIQIDEDAFPPRGKEVNGTAHITDPKATDIILPDGTVKHRPAITDPASMTIHFAGQMVTPLKDGNPTRTAWAFLRVIEGKQEHIYCIVPLPPGY